MFCDRKITITYQVLGNAPVSSCKCGSLYFLSTKPSVYMFMEMRGLHVIEPDYELDLSLSDIARLRTEGKIRDAVIERNKNGDPVVHLIEVFPVTDGELMGVFTPNQVAVIKKNLFQRKAMEAKDKYTLLRVRKKKDMISTRYHVVKKLFF